MRVSRAAHLLCAVLVSCGTVKMGHTRSLKQSSACITSTTTVDFTTQGLAIDPWCLQVGEFSVLCPRTPNQPCACPTLSYVNVTSERNNLLGCYDPSLYFCNTISPQWIQTASNYGHTALIQGSGASNIGVCWNQANQSLSDWGTANNALLPSAAAVAKASADAMANQPAAAPAAAPSRGSLDNAEDSNAGKIAGIICAIVGPAFAALLWLSVTFSHRQEKAMVIAGVTQHIATSDITNNSTALIGTTHGEAQNQLAKSSLKLSLDTASDSQSGLGRDSMIQQSMTRSTSDTSRTLDRTASMASSIGRTPSEMQRIGLLGQLHRSAPVEEETTTEADPALVEVRKVARKITARCLRRWDSFLAVRADKDSLGNSAGVWKVKFESVRSAVMLLAFRNVNAMLQMQVLRATPGAPDPPGSLMAAWETGNSHERSNLVTLITKTLQDITLEEAQALRCKDHESPGLHDRLSNIFEVCTSKMSFKRQDTQPNRERSSSGSYAANQI